jgi:hypothetical protein
MPTSATLRLRESITGTTPFFWFGQKGANACSQIFKDPAHEPQNHRLLKHFPTPFLGVYGVLLGPHF